MCLFILDDENRRLTEEIEGAAFIVCLDKGTEFDILNYIHGGKENSHNRWYDSTLQIIVNEAGDFGLSYEHSVCEGIPIVNMAQTIKKQLKTTKEKYYFGTKEVPFKQFQSTGEVHKASLAAEQRLLTLQSRLDMEKYHFKSFGKNFIKKQNMSPDAFVQVALQLSYHEIYNRLCSTYESASLRRFKNGRVDNIRAATTAALQFCKYIHDNPAPLVRLIKKIKFQINSDVLNFREQNQSIFSQKRFDFKLKWLN